ncbi:MAG TPA: aldose 1-epimerase [Terriglobales bacterium]|nr:aldose 1-epimerase [Terriglobales bacterium]
MATAARLLAQEQGAQYSAKDGVITLQPPAAADKSRPHFISAIVLPDHGMAVLQIKAYLPGKGEIDLLNSPPLPEAQQALNKGDDEFGNQIFKMGGAILLPFANRIRGNLSADGKTITANIAGHTVTLPANWSGNQPGAEKHAIHGLMRRSKFGDVKLQNGQTCAAIASLQAGNFDGHWLSDTDVKVKVSMSGDAFELSVTATNVGHQLLPMGIGWHPYFVIPSGDRKQVLLHIPSQTRAVMNNYDDSFTTGERVPVKGTGYDFTAPAGRRLGSQYLDDNYSDLQYNSEGQTISAIVDPAAKFGLRLTTLSPQIKSIQVYAPPQKNFVAIEPQFNLPDPYNKNWGNTDTGMVLLKRGQSVTWRVRLELFTPSSEPSASSTAGVAGRLHP